MAVNRASKILLVRCGMCIVMFKSELEYVRKCKISLSRSAIELENTRNLCAPRTLLFAFQNFSIHKMCQGLENRSLMPAVGTNGCCVGVLNSRECCLFIDAA